MLYRHFKLKWMGGVPTWRKLGKGEGEGCQQCDICCKICLIRTISEGTKVICPTLFCEWKSSMSTTFSLVFGENYGTCKLYLMLNLSHSGEKRMRTENNVFIKVLLLTDNPTSIILGQLFGIQVLYTMYYAIFFMDRTNLEVLELTGVLEKYLHVFLSQKNKTSFTN